MRTQAAVFPTSRPAIPAPRRRLLPAALVLAIGLSACGKGGGGSVDSARAFLEKGDARAAVIELKSTLQKSPDNAPARLLLGRALVASGDAAGAVVEFRKAQELGMAAQTVAPELARALLVAGEPKKVVEQFADIGFDDKAALGDLKISVATAQAAVGDLKAAQATLAEARRLAPSMPQGVLLSARFKAAEGDTPGALFILDELLRQPGSNAEALLFKGELLAAQKNDAEAVAAWKAALQAKPDLVGAHLALVQAAILRNDADAAAAQVEDLKKARPGQPETLFAEAQVKSAKSDWAATRELTSQLLKLGAEDVRVLMLAATAEYQLKSYPQAEALAGRALKVQPRLLGARQLLARTYLRTGQAARVIDVLQPALEQAQPDPLTLSLAGEAYLVEGDAKKAEAMFAAADKAAPNNARIRTALAVTQLATGPSARALGELESIAAADASPRADLALISARLRAEDTAGALKAIDALQKKMPDKALPHVLRGRVQLARKDNAAAVASFEKALAVDAKYFPAAASLAALELNAGKPEAARKRFETLLQADPRNTRALIAIADLRAREGADADEVARLLGEAIKAGPAEATPRLLLIEDRLKRGDSAAALQAAQEATASLPNDPVVMESLGRAQLAAKQGAQAVTTFTKLAQLQATRPEPTMWLAEAHRIAGDNEAADRALRKALEVEPRFLPAQRAQVQLALQRGKPDDALAVAKQVIEQRPKEAAGWLLTADVEASRKRWPEAEAALRTALKVEPTTPVAVAMHTLLRTAGNGAEAERFATGWTREHPKDPRFFFYLGDVAMAAGDQTAAEARYRAVLAADPKNALAANNVAWLMAKQNKPGAVEMAERANELLPNRPALLDTLSTALAAAGQGPRALEVQKRAVQLSGNDPSMRLSLARIQLQVGNKDQARSELESLAKLGDKFAAQAEVSKLLASL